MKITIDLTSCEKCKHFDHSGNFTPGGAKPVCGHDGAIEIMGAGKKDKYDWRHRIIPYKVVTEKIGTRVYQARVAKKIPSWCPMKNGYNY